MPTSLTEKHDSRKWNTGDNATERTALGVERLRKDVKNNKPAFV